MRGGKRDNAGRPKGMPNKANENLRNLIDNLLSDKWEQIEQDFESLEPKDRINLYVKLLGYVLPRLQSVDAIEDNQDKVIRVLFDE